MVYQINFSSIDNYRFRTWFTKKQLMLVDRCMLDFSFSDKHKSYLDKINYNSMGNAENRHSLNTSYNDF